MRTGDSQIQVFEPHPSNDLTEFGAQTDVYAASDGLWAMFLKVDPEDFPFLKDIRVLDDARLQEYGQAMQAGAPWPE